MLLYWQVCRGYFGSIIKVRNMDNKASNFKNLERDVRKILMDFFDNEYEYKTQNNGKFNEDFMISCMCDIFAMITSCGGSVLNYKSFFEDKMEGDKTL